MLIQHKKEQFCNLIADSTPNEANRIRPSVVKSYYVVC